MKYTGNQTETDPQIATWMAHGCVMSPSDVREAQGKRIVPERVTWTLCGHVPEVAELLRRGGVQLGPAERIRMARSPAGFLYLLVVHQVGTWQHRWILSMGDPLVQDLLKDVERGKPLGIALVGNDESAHVWRSQLSAERAHAMRIRFEREAQGPFSMQAQDFAVAAIELCWPGAVASLLQETEVAKVSVTAIPPDGVHHRRGLKGTQ